MFEKGCYLINKMQKLCDIPGMAEAIDKAPSKSVKLLYKLIFDDESRLNRKKLKEFKGFLLESDSSELEERVNSVKNSYSVADLTAVCILLQLKYDDTLEKLALTVCTALNNLEMIPRLSEKQEHDEETEDEDDDDVNESRSLRSVTRSEQAVKFMMSARDLEDVVRQFSGNKSEPVDAWIKEFEETATLMEWTEMERLIYAKRSLTGLARLFVQSEKGIKSWVILKQRLRSEFKRKVNSATVHEMLSERKMKKDESVHEYFLVMKELANRAAIEDEAIIHYIIAGINDTCERKAILYEAATMESFKSKLIAYEKLSKSRSVPSTNTKVKRQEVITKTKFEPKCFNCHEKGHLASACSKPKQRLCFKCKSADHVGKDCPKRTNSEEKPAVMTVKSILPVESIKKYLKDVFVNNRVICAMIDPGSSVCTICECVVDRYGWATEPVVMSLSGFGKSTTNQSIKCTKAVRAHIRVDEVELNNVVMYVVPNDAQEIDVIVGRSFTDDESIIYYRIDNQLNFAYRGNTPNVDLVVKSAKSKSQIKTTEVVTIDSGAVMFVNAMVDEQVVAVPISNNGSSKCVVPENTVIGKVKQPIAEVQLVVNACKPVDSEMIKVDESTTPEVKDVLVTLFNKYRQCVAMNLDEIGCTDVMEMKIVDDNVPVRKKPYRASMTERETMKEIVGEWKRTGIVTETTSEYASPVLLVKKKTGEARLVVDFRDMNRKCIKPVYPIPTIDEQFENLSGCKIFTTLDLAHGYLQIPLNESSRKKTAFITPDETGEFTRMMFGLTTAPYEFCRLMHLVLGPLRNKVCMCYIDDILIGARDWPEMLNKLELVLQAFKEAKLTLKLTKCVFGLKRVEFLGFEITEHGMEPGKVKVDAVREFPIPSNVHELRRFLGLTSYFRRFVKNYAVRARPLSDLTRKNTKFKWASEQQNAFEDLRDSLCDNPVLKLYNPRAERTEVHTDTSSSGLAGVMLQADEGGVMHPVYYVSKKTTDVEAKYHSSKLELMAIVWVVERLRPLLIGLKFVVYTDCQAIVYLNVGKTQNSQIARWFHTLQEYDVEVKYRPGTKMVHVDALSRAPVRDATDTESEVEARIWMCMDEDDYVTMIQYGDKEVKQLIEILKKEEEAQTEEEK